MANPEQLSIFKQGVSTWNEWRAGQPGVPIDLSGIDASGLDLKGIRLAGANLINSDFSGCDLSSMATSLQNANFSFATLHATNLSRAEMQGAILCETKFNDSATVLYDTSLMGADASRADFSGANLEKVKINDARAWHAKFIGTNLKRAHFWRTDFREANFSKAKLQNANLMCTQLVKTNFEEADLTGAKVYGIAAWDINQTNAVQLNLIITHTNEPAILADDLEVAQFIHLLINNQKIRDIIDTVTSKTVLILGNFSEERKEVLDKIRSALRTMNLVPILFDFGVPFSKTITGTVETLARLARFIIADLTDPRSIGHEMASIIPRNTKTPVLPIRLHSAKKNTPCSTISQITNGCCPFTNTVTPQL
jgi:uncharacterized protein YjbI with pentapeptide repeats